MHVDARVGETSERPASGAGLEKALVTLRRIGESEERSLIERPARGRAKPVWGRAIRPNGKQVKIMTTEMSFVDSALRGWKSNVERADKLFGALSPEQLEKEVAPGKNRLIYLWGHLAAVNDGLLPLLGIGGRLHPEFEVMFLSNPDKSIQLKVSGQSLKGAWQEINQKLWDGFLKFSASDWAQRHTAVSEEDFKREPHRNRFTVLLGRTAHLAYHLGQATLALPKAQ
jgi:hypothetical protein